MRTYGHCPVGSGVVEASGEALSSLDARLIIEFGGLEFVHFLLFVALHSPSSGPRTCHSSPGHTRSG